MASILKVSQLQKPDGSTPTAADLGIDVAGSVVQVVSFNDTNAPSLYINSTSPTATTLTATITPKYANSKLYVSTSFTFGLDDSDNAFVIGTLMRNGTDRLAEHFLMKDMPNAGRNNASASIAYTDSPNTTNPVTYALYAHSTHVNLDFRYGNYETYKGNSIVIFEIAQ